MDNLETRLTVVEAHIDHIRQDISSLRSDFREQRNDLTTTNSNLGKVRTDVAVLKWMVGFMLALQLGTLARLLFVH